MRHNVLGNWADPWSVYHYPNDLNNWLVFWGFAGPCTVQYSVMQASRTHVPSLDRCILARDINCGTQ